MKAILSLFLLALITPKECSTRNEETKAGPLDDLINRLADKVNSFQVLKEQNYSPPFKWAEKRGLFKSDIRVNVFGNPLVQEIRNGELTAVFDNDMFSTGWILTTMLEATLYGKGAPDLDPKRLQMALETIGSYRDHDEKNAEKSIIRTFWPQIVNETDGIWYQQPINIRNIALNIAKIPFDKIENVLRFLKLDKLADAVDNFKEVGKLADEFCIPPDFDDTYLNLGLGATLYRLESVYPKAYTSWLANNTEVARLAEVTSKYAYRPFDTDFNKNIIDTRTYFWIRGFLQEAQANNQSLALITTWIQNIEEQRYRKYEKIQMPFNSNNVDVTVCANSIYGITSAALFNINDFASVFLGSTDLQQVYLNSTKLISWAIQSNFTARPDLAQVYYPSLFNFLWYASRTLFLINNEYEKVENFKSGKLDETRVKRLKSLENVFSEAKSYLETAFENSATSILLTKAIPVTDTNETSVYFRDFLGLNDTSVLGKPESNNEDALFSTAQAINILISTWTVQRADKPTLVWKSHTPDNVKTLLQSSVNWLKENIFSKKLKAANAFFSGSVKGLTSLPFWYPANYVKYLNGSDIVDPDKLPREAFYESVVGVQNLMDEQEFQKQLHQMHFNYSTPIDFHGYNTKDNVFPYWSSEPYTYSCALLAFAQYNNLE